MENELIWRVFNISFTASFVIGLLLLLMPLLYKRYQARWRYYVWLIMAVRLLIPFNAVLPKTAVSIPTNIIIPAASAPVAIRGEVPAVYVSSDETSIIAPVDMKTSAFQYSTGNHIPPEQSKKNKAEEQTAVFSLSKLFGSIWLAGIVIFFLIQVFIYIIFLRKLYYSPRYEISPGIRIILYESGKELKIDRLPEIRVCGAVPAPILTRFFRPILLLPHDKYGEREMLFILRHELMHFKRCDLFYKLIIAAAKIVHWFNPFVWLMSAQADRDLELSCDDLVMAGLSNDDRIFYGETILNTLPIKSKWRLEPLLATSFGSTKQNIKQRLKNLFDYSMKKKGIAAFCIVTLLAAFISGVVVITPAIAAGNEDPNENPTKVAFSDNDEGDSRVMFGPYTLKEQESCVVTLIWNEGGTQSIQFIKEDPTGRESTMRTEHQITNREPLTVTAWEDGNYRFVIPAGSGMTGIVCLVDYSGTENIDKANTNAEYVSFDEVGIRTYDDGSPYIHDILSNNTSRNITAYERGMLAFDKNGQPLKIKWLESDSDALPAYSFLYDWGFDDIPAGDTRDVFGGWSLFGGNPYAPDPAPEIVWEIEYVLYNLKQVMFDDGSKWINPDYENWLKTYEGKQTDPDALNMYYPYIMEIRDEDISDISGF